MIHHAKSAVSICYFICILKKVNRPGTAADCQQTLPVSVKQYWLCLGVPSGYRRRLPCKLCRLVISAGYASRSSQ